MKTVVLRFPMTDPDKAAGLDPLVDAINEMTGASAARDGNAVAIAGPEDAVDEVVQNIVGAVVSVGAVVIDGNTQAVGDA